MSREGEQKGLSLLKAAGREDGAAGKEDSRSTTGGSKTDRVSVGKPAPDDRPPVSTQGLPDKGAAHCFAYFAEVCLAHLNPGPTSQIPGETKLPLNGKTEKVCFSTVWILQ